MTSEIREKLIKFYEKVPIGMWALLASGTIVISFIIAALGYAYDYTGEIWSDYSIMNHAISELGMWDGWGQLFFNTGLIIGGLLYIPFFIGLGMRFNKNYTKYLLTPFGIYIAINASLVGVFPGDENMALHGITAMTFFMGGMVLTLTYSIATAFQKIFSKLLILPGLVSAAFFAIFLSIPSFIDTDLSGMFGGGATNRPDIIPFLFWEWMALFGILLWLGTWGVVLRNDRLQDNLQGIFINSD